MNGKDIVRYLRWIAVNDQAVMCPQLAKEAADFIEAALGIISTYPALLLWIRTPSSRNYNRFWMPKAHGSWLWAERYLVLIDGCLNPYQ